MSVIVVKNNTAVDVFIPDIGMLIPASGSDTYATPGFTRVVAISQDLRSFVTAGTLTVNDGVADIPTAEVDGFLLSFFVSGGSNSGIPANTLLAVEDHVIPIADLVSLDTTKIISSTVNGRSYTGWNLPDGVVTRAQIAVPTPRSIDDMFSPSLALSFVAPTDSLPTGDVRIQTQIAYRADSSVAGDADAYAFTQDLSILVPATGAAQNAIVKTNMIFPVASILPIPGVAMLSIARLGAAPADTYTGNVVVLAAIFRFRKKMG